MVNKAVGWNCDYSAVSSDSAEFSTFSLIDAKILLFHYILLARISQPEISQFLARGPAAALTSAAIGHKMPIVK
jgi:hypothetical protein